MIGAIILAAGRSRRMGTQKLLMTVQNDRPLIRRVVDETLRSPLDPILVVVRPDSGAIRHALASTSASFVENPDPESSMLGSVRCGIRALPDGWQAVVIIPGDSPGLSAEVLHLLIRSHRMTGRSLVVPTCHGRRGHPLLVASRHRDEILTHHDQEGLRGLVRLYQNEVLDVPWHDTGILDDLDTPEDYARWLSKSAPAHRGVARAGSALSANLPAHPLRKPHGG